MDSNHRNLCNSSRDKRIHEFIETVLEDSRLKIARDSPLCECKRIPSNALSLAAPDLTSLVA